ncbi:unnamed protein product [Durusdinium trenchii]|uniref:Uncharacterized protein n=1 Tax=Durusdinium trenchii TaxID=1381693 RepID=A0ABP0QKU4_9DINO
MLTMTRVVSAPSWQSWGGPCVCVCRCVTVCNLEASILSLDRDCNLSSILRMTSRHRDGHFQKFGWAQGAGPSLVCWRPWRDHDHTSFTIYDFGRVWYVCLKIWSQFIEADQTVTEQQLHDLWEKSAEFAAGLGFPAASEAIDVIQEVHHQEPAKTIDESFSSECTGALWVSSLQAQPMPSSSELAVLLTFNRHPASMDAALKRSDLGRRLAASQHEIQPPWANGAKIMVMGLDEAVWHRAIREADLPQSLLQLKAYHVVAPANKVDDILGIVAEIPGSSRPRLKAGSEPVSVPNPEVDASKFQVSEPVPPRCRSSMTLHQLRLCIRLAVTTSTTTLHGSRECVRRPSTCRFPT